MLGASHSKMEDVLYLFNPQMGHGVYTTPIDFYSIRFCTLHTLYIQYIIYLYTHKKLGLIRLF